MFKTDSIYQKFVLTNYLDDIKLIIVLLKIKLNTTFKKIRIEITVWLVEQNCGDKKLAFEPANSYSKLTLFLR